MGKTKLILLGIAGAVLIGVLAWPVKTVCPNGPCTSAPDADGYVHRYYEIQPLGTALIASVTNRNLPLHYSSGIQKD